MDMPSEIAATAVIQDSIEDVVQGLEEPWRAKLPFLGHVCASLGEFSETFDKVNETELELFDYVDKASCLWGQMIRFDPCQYPIEGGLNGQGFQSLVGDLIEASKQHGRALLYSNGGGKTCRRLHCTHGRNRRKVFALNQQKEAVDNLEGELNGENTISRKNKRGPNDSGKRGARKTLSTRPDEHTCRVSLILAVDDNSFYLKCGKGGFQHEGHLPAAAEEMKRHKHRGNVNTKAQAASNAMAPQPDANIHVEADANTHVQADANTHVQATEPYSQGTSMTQTLSPETIATQAMDFRYPIDERTGLEINDVFLTLMPLVNELISLLSLCNDRDRVESVRVELIRMINAHKEHLSAVKSSQKRKSA